MTLVGQPSGMFRCFSTSTSLALGRILTIVIDTE